MREVVAEVMALVCRRGEGRKWPGQARPELTDGGVDGNCRGRGEASGSVERVRGRRVGWKGEPGSFHSKEEGGFYIFTIITNVTHQIITLKMTPTTIATERSLSFIFTTFADVARHASCTRWHPVSRLKCNVLPAPDLLLSPLSPTAGSPQLISLPCGARTTALSPISSSACGETETEGKGGAQAHVHELEVVLVVLEHGADGAVTASSAAAPAPLTRHTCPSRRREGGPLRWRRGRGAMGAGATSSTASGL